MNADSLLENLDIVIEAQGGINRLRELILGLATQGRLSSPSSSDTSVVTLLELIAQRHKPNVAMSPPRFPIPDHWEWVAVGSIAEHQLGKMLNKSRNNGALRKYLRTANVGSRGEFDLSEIKEMVIPHDELEKYRVRKGDLFVNEGGDVGKSAIWASDADDFAFQNHLHRLRPLGGITSQFLQLVLHQARVAGALLEMSAGVTIQNLSANSIRKLAIPLPPLAEQSRIVAKVDELMTLCDQIEQAKKQRNEIRTAARKSAIDAISNATTPEELRAAWKRINNNWDVIAGTPESVESLRALILRLAVSGKFTEASRETSHSEMQSVSLGNLMSMEYGKPLDKLLRKSSGNVPVYGANGIKTMTHQAFVKHQGIVIGRKGSAGEVNLTDGPFWPLDVTFFAKFDNSVLDLKFLYYQLKSLDLPTMARGIKPGINRNDVYKIKVVSIDLEEQKKIVVIIDKLMALCDQLESGLKSRSEVAEKFARSVASAA